MRDTIERMQLPRSCATLGLLLLLLGALLRLAGESNASPSSRASSFSFTAAGDFGGTTNTDAVLNGIASAGAQFHLTLGDLSYGTYAPESAWCSYVQSKVGASFPFELVSGNHDMDGQPTGHINTFARCLPDRIGNLTGTYGKEYYFDYQNLARIIFISPNLTLDGETYAYAAGGAHYAWLANAIDSARLANIPWVVVAMHKNCITTGVKSCEIGADLFNLLVNKKVDLVLQGHDHNYQRAKQLVFNGTTCTSILPGSYNANCVVDDGADNDYTKGSGMLLTIAGTGGQSLYGSNPADAEAGYFAKIVLPTDTARYGFLKVTVTATELRAQFVPVTSGTFTDAYTISSPPPPAPTATLAVPTATTLASFTARAPDAAHVRVNWRTATETNVLGFTVWRRRAGLKFWEKKKPEFIPAKISGHANGARYRFRDGTVVSGGKYLYQLEILRADHRTDWSQVVKVKVP